MHPFHDYSLRDIIASKWTDIHNTIDKFTNDEIMANDLEILSENLYQQFFIDPLRIYDEDVSKRNVKQKKIKHYIDPYLRDYYDHEYVEVDGIIAEFYYPYQGNSELFQCYGSTIILGRYPEITVDNTHVIFQIERSLSDMNKSEAKEKLLDTLNKDVSEIRQGIAFVNSDVETFNNSLKIKALTLLQERRKKVESFYTIATMFEVPVERTAFAKTIIPVQRKIVPISKKYDSSNYYCISDMEYKDILSVIKHNASTYERTPESCKTLQEEDMRNFLLASLNAVYLGGASGETFRNKGKTDICIEKENRAAFVAECKMWSGKKAIAKAIEQLDSYLTWRDCKTALIYFVRRQNFLSVLEDAEKALRDYDNMRNVTAVDKNEFECLFISKANPGQQIKMSVMLFDLHC